MFVFHFVKHFAAGWRCNSCGQLMSHTDVEHVDVAVDAASFAIETLAVAVAVKNDDVENDDFNKTII